MTQEPSIANPKPGRALLRAAIGSPPRAANAAAPIATNAVPERIPGGSPLLATRDVPERRANAPELIAVRYEPIMTGRDADAPGA